MVSRSMGILLGEGIGDTVRVSLTPRPNGDRRDEVYAAVNCFNRSACALLRPASPRAPAAAAPPAPRFRNSPKAFRATSATKCPSGSAHYEGVEELKLAVMGCIVNGPGESKAANIGISLPGTGETPRCPVYIDGQKFTTLEGTYDELSRAFQAF